MTLHAPFEISPSLELALHIGDAWLCLSYDLRFGREGRTRYRWTLILPGQDDQSGDDLQSGAFDGDLQSGFASLLSFLGTAAEAYQYADRMGYPHFQNPDSNETLFPPAVVEWAAANSDELSMLACVIEEAAPGSLIVE
jgi:hypothetical protein